MTRTHRRALLAAALTIAAILAVTPAVLADQAPTARAAAAKASCHPRPKCATPTPTATATPSPEPTATATTAPPTPTPTTATPTPTATPTGDCALPRYPTPDCTGVPAGTVLADLPGGYAITTPGAVLDAVHVHGDLFVRAAGAVITRSQIDGNVFNTDTGAVYEPYTITDSTVGTPGACITSPGIGWANYTAVRVRIVGHDDGWRVDGPGHVRITDSYAKLCWNPPELAPPDGSHSGGMQADCTLIPCGDVTFIHNTVDNFTVVGGQRVGNSAITMQSFAGNPVIGPFEASDNLLIGGGYVIWFWWTLGDEPWLVHGNRVVDGSWVYGPVDSHDSCAHQDWVGNTLVSVAGWDPARTYAGGYDITSTVSPLECVA